MKRVIETVTDKAYWFKEQFNPMKRCEKDGRRGNMEEKRFGVRGCNEGNREEIEEGGGTDHN